MPVGSGIASGGARTVPRGGPKTGWTSFDFSKQSIAGTRVAPVQGCGWRADRAGHHRDHGDECQRIRGATFTIGSRSRARDQARNTPATIPRRSTVPMPSVMPANDGPRWAPGAIRILDLVGLARDHMTLRRCRATSTKRAPRTPMASQPRCYVEISRKIGRHGLGIRDRQPRSTDQISRLIPSSARRRPAV